MVHMGNVRHILPYDYDVPYIMMLMIYSTSYIDISITTCTIQYNIYIQYIYTIQNSGSLSGHTVHHSPYIDSQHKSFTFLTTHLEYFRCCHYGRTSRCECFSGPAIDSVAAGGYSIEVAIDDMLWYLRHSGTRRCGRFVRIRDLRLWTRNSNIACQFQCVVGNVWNCICMKYIHLF